MRTKHVIVLAFVVLVVVLAGWSFQANVLDPHPDGVPPTGAGGGGTTTVPAGSTAMTEEMGSGEEGGSAPASDVLPAVLGGRDQSILVEGAEALVQVEQLHGKELGDGMTDAWVAQYGPQGELTVWVSRSPDAAAATVLLDRMTERIAEGTSPFTNLEATAEDGVEVYGLDGMGQRHYYFQLGAELYWVAAPLSVAEEAAAELIAHWRAGHGQEGPAEEGTEG